MKKRGGTAKRIFVLAHLSVLLLLVPNTPIAQRVLADSVATAGLSIVFPLMAPKLSSQYGNRKHPVLRSVRHHSGVDLAAPRDSYVRSVADGLVVFSDRLGSYGRLVSVQHGRGYTSLYGHLNESLVSPGQRVRAGDILGRVGSTGRATGPHLHFEWRKDGKPLDPLKVFPALVTRAEG